MKTRRVISLTAFLSFIILAYTGIMLFFCPEGRVAYWTGWKLLGLSKTQYGQVHTTFMVLFLVTGIWHIVLNWNPILNYLKDRAKKIRIFTPEFNISLLISVFFLVGTLAGWFPFHQFLNGGEAIKLYWADAKGVPPWGHAEQNNIKRFVRGLEVYEAVENQRLVTINEDDALSELRSAGIEVEGKDSVLLDIAEANGTTPQALMDIMLRAAKPLDSAAGSSSAQTQAFEEGEFPMPFSGLGKMTLRSYAEKYEAELQRVLSILEEKGMAMDPDKRIKEEADRLGTDPEGIIDLLNE
jgi:hypothetical protein